MRALRVLIVEDSEDDARLLVEHLRRAGYQVTSERVQTASAMTTALATREWDLVLSDYRMPQFSAQAALDVLQASGRDVPCIIVSGTIGEDTAVACLKAGARDFLLKQNLARLVPAIERELRDLQVRQEWAAGDRALRDSERRYREMVEGLSVGIYRTAPDGTLLDANAVCLDMFGLPTGSTPRAINVLSLYVDPSDRERWRATAERGGLLGGTELQVRRADGSVIWVRDTARVVRGAGGEVRCYEGVLENITALRAAQEETRRSEARFRALIEYGTDIVAILDADVTFRYLSPSVTRILGYQPAELVERNALEYIHPDDADALRLIIGSGLADPSYPGRGTYRFRHKDGAWRYLDSTGRNLLDEPSVGGLVINSRDVTERVLMEQELSKRRRELEALVENAPDAIERFDRELRFTYANPAVETVRGLPRGGLTGKTHRDVGVPEGDAALWETKLREVFETGRECTFEFGVSARTAGTPGEE